MNTHIATMLVLVAAASAAHPFEGLAQDAASRAAAVLAEARKALGGDEKLRAVKTLQAAGDYRRAMGEMNMEGELEFLIEPPDRMRRNETMGVSGGATMVRSEVLNGDEVWDDNSQRGGMGGHMTMVLRGPGGREMSPEQLNEMRKQARRAELARYMLAWLLAADVPIVHAGVAEAPDGKADVLEVKPAQGPGLRLFIDQQTHMPLMLAWKGPPPRMLVRRSQGGGPPNLDRVERDPAIAEGPPPEANYEMRLEDYRKVGGIQLPHLITRTVNGTANEEWTIKGYKVNAPFKGNTFTK